MSDVAEPQRAVRFPDRKKQRHGGAIASLVVAAVVLGVAAWTLYAHSDPESFARAFADLLLQLALIVVLGTVVKIIVDRYAERRARLEREHTQRLELLRRMRAQHVKVAFAQRLMCAHQSGKTYTEQMRAMMIVGAELEDLAEDVKATGDLFGNDQDEVIAGISAIVEYLNAGSDEYVVCHAKVDADAVANKNLPHMMATHEMVWVRDFTNAFPDLPAPYAEALTKSKGTMRQHAYGG